MRHDKITHRGKGSNESEYFVHVSASNDENGNMKEKNYGVYVDALIPEGFFSVCYKTRE
jgi:hypothetical protein